MTDLIAALERAAKWGRTTPADAALLSALAEALRDLTTEAWWEDQEADQWRKGNAVGFRAKSCAKIVRERLERK